VISNAFGKITNLQGEIVAEGACEIDDERGSVTLRPLLDSPLLERQRGPMRLTLDTGQEIMLSDRVIHFRLNLPGERPGSVYRLSIAPRPRPSAPWQRATGNEQRGAGEAAPRETDARWER
jgi:hypothetical protein